MSGTDAEVDTWDMTYRPRRGPRIAVVVAIVILAIHITFGALLTISDTGVHVGLSDQFGIALIGAVEAAAVLLFTRSRLRVGSSGVGVRNLVSERIFEWDQVLGLTYPDKALCARLLLPYDEHIPVFAVASGDRERAVEAMNEFRTLFERYRPDAVSAGH